MRPCPLCLSQQTPNRRKGFPFCVDTTHTTYSCPRRSFGLSGQSCAASALLITIVVYLVVLHPGSNAVIRCTNLYRNQIL